MQASVRNRPPCQGFPTTAPAASRNHILLYYPWLLGHDKARAGGYTRVLKARIDDGDPADMAGLSWPPATCRRRARTFTRINLFQRGGADEDGEAVASGGWGHLHESNVPDTCDIESVPQFQRILGRVRWVGHSKHQAGVSRGQRGLWEYPNPDAISLQRSLNWDSDLWPIQ